MYKHIFATLTFVTVAWSFGGCSSSSSSGGGACNADTDCKCIVQNSQYTGNACNNADDRCFLNANEAIVRKIGGYCATQPAPTGCIGFAADPTSQDAINCFTTCFTREIKKAPPAGVGSAPSSACQLCTDKVVICGAQFCLSECATAPDSSACTACLCAQHTAEGGFSGNCLQDAFAECAGFRPTNAQIGCP